MYAWDQSFTICFDFFFVTTVAIAAAPAATPPTIAAFFLLAVAALACPFTVSAAAAFVVLLILEAFAGFSSTAPVLATLFILEALAGFSSTSFVGLSLPASMRQKHWVLASLKGSMVSCWVKVSSSCRANNGWIWGQESYNLHNQLHSSGSDWNQDNAGAQPPSGQYFLTFAGQCLEHRSRAFFDHWPQFLETAEMQQWNAKHINKPIMRQLLHAAYKTFC